MSAWLRAKAVLRRFPGLVPAKRVAIAAYRLVRPLRPPVESPALVTRMLIPADDDGFITGNGFAEQCRYVVNYDRLRVNEDVENDWWFCNPEFLEYFFRSVEPDEEHVLFTHNSNVDRGIGRRFERRLRRPELVAWFSINVELRHPKLRSIPLGVGNRIKCDHALLRRVQESRLSKSALFEASFDARTNERERRYCIEQTGIQPTPKRATQLEYFEQLASAYFCISPNGNGIDCYRTWQAFSLRTIPIVTRSPLTEQHPDLPWIVLDNWSEFGSIEFSPALYEQTLGAWEPSGITLGCYLERVQAVLRHLRDPARAGTKPRSAWSTEAGSDIRS